METRHFWQDNGHAVKYESFNATEEFRGEQLGFAAPSEDEDYQAGYLRKGKVSRQDPMSHRIIEKRRRDRMNNCLADLSRLIPPEYLKKGRGRVEKTEIIEMAIRHLKFLQERANGERPRENRQKRPPCSSSETMSSSSSQGYVSPQSLNTRRPEPPPAPKPYEQTDQYPRECDRVKSVIAAPNDAPPNSELMALDGCHKREPTLRNIRKPEQGEDFLHSYKFKNSIERRFSRSQDCEATDMTVRGGPHKNYGHKRRRVNKTTPSTTSNSNSGSVSTEDTRDTSPQETSNDSTHHHYEKPLSPAAQYVPVFALNSIGKYYVPLSVDYSCLARQLGPHDALAAHAAARAALHPITIHVNFQPCLDQLVKREPGAQEWRPA